MSTASKIFAATQGGSTGPFIFATPKRASFKLTFSAKASIRSSSPGRDGPAEVQDAAALVDNTQLDKINDNLGKLCQRVCRLLEGGNLDESLAYLDQMEH